MANNKKDTISVKHQMFVDEYMSNGCNATKAYLTVYKNVKPSVAQANSSKLLLNTIIQAEIKRQQEINKQKNDVSYEEIMTTLKQIVIDNTQTNTNAALKAIDTINKMKGFYGLDNNQKMEINNGNGSIVINIIKPDDKQLE